MTVRDADLHSSATTTAPASDPAFAPVAIDHFLALVEKPQRYIGGERNARHSPLSADVVKWALCFPEVYEIGMSHLGLKILYAILNDQPGAMADRAYCPWTDMEAEMRKRGVPAFAHESRAPLRAFDVLGFSLQYELTYGNVLTMLDLAGIPLHAADRREGDPIVIGGGPCMANPEPVADFFDAFLIGDGRRRCSRSTRRSSRIAPAAGTTPCASWPRSPGSTCRPSMKCRTTRTARWRASAAWIPTFRSR